MATEQVLADLGSGLRPHPPDPFLRFRGCSRDESRLHPWAGFSLSASPFSNPKSRAGRTKGCPESSIFFALSLLLLEPCPIPSSFSRRFKSHQKVKELKSQSASKAPGDPNPWTLKVSTSTDPPPNGLQMLSSLCFSSFAICFPPSRFGDGATCRGWSPASLSSRETWPSPFVTLFCLSKVLLQPLLLFLSLLGFLMALGIFLKSRGIPGG